MRFSQYFRLNFNQDELDFVDVDVTCDTPVYLDPSAIRLLDYQWSHECVSLIQNFFENVLGAMRSGNDRRAISLLRGLSEPNETHLGMSKRGTKSRGRALGPHLVNDVWRALKNSNAIKTGLIQDVEDSLLFIEGVGPDLISDMVTNIIREPLIHYTQGVCNHHSIRLANVDSGYLWDPNQGKWIRRYEGLPLGSTGKIILVPKIIVRRKLDYDAEEYNRDFILPFLQQEEITAGTSLVKVLKNGTPKVTKKSVAEKYGTGKRINTDISLKNPDILDAYRKTKGRISNLPLSHEDFAEITTTPAPDWDALLKSVTDLPCGSNDATNYEVAIEKLLNALFYPSLINPVRQSPLHSGRKRVDIVYTNSGVTDFYRWLAKHHPAAYVFVECKNYTGDIGNPELDQLIGRFSATRGKFGLMFCRKFDDKQVFIERCRDSAKDGQGFVIVLDDIDLANLVAMKRDKRQADIDNFLHARFRELVM